MDALVVYNTEENLIFFQPLSPDVPKCSPIMSNRNPETIAAIQNMLLHKNRFMGAKKQQQQQPGIGMTIHQQLLMPYSVWLWFKNKNTNKYCSIFLGRSNIENHMDQFYGRNK